MWAWAPPPWAGPLLTTAMVTAARDRAPPGHRGPAITSFELTEHSSAMIIRSHESVSKWDSPFIGRVC